MTIITHLKNIIGIAVLVSVIFCFFTNAENINNTIFTSMTFCLNTLIPSLFPYMVISSFFSRSSLINQGLTALFYKAFKHLGVCKKYIFPILLGNLFGFLNGPKALCEKFVVGDSKYAFKKSHSNAKIA